MQVSSAVDVDVVEVVADEVDEVLELPELLLVADEPVVVDDGVLLLVVTLFPPAGTLCGELAALVVLALEPCDVLPPHPVVPKNSRDTRNMSAIAHAVLAMERAGKTETEFADVSVCRGALRRYCIGVG